MTSIGWRRRALLGLLTAVLWASAGAQAQAAGGPPPGSPAYVQRDNQNMQDAYGREFAPGGQLNNPNYLPALLAQDTEVGFQQLTQQLATPNRLAITPGNVFPGWNSGNPLRAGWSGKRGLMVPVAWTNRYGALIRGDVFAPLPGAHDPYTGAALHAPYPGVVITTGSVQGSEHMYWWLAEDLAERGYVVLTYDVQGQGTSETLPHQGPVDALPFCNPFAPPQGDEGTGCPGVPFQQSSNFIYGTEDALGFFLSTPDQPYPNPRSSDAQVNAFNPLWNLFDRSPDRRSVTPGRTTRVAIIGHSLGAFAVSYVQGIDPRVEAVVALDKLTAGGSTPAGSIPPVKPVVPALAVQSEYGFWVSPYWANNGSSLSPQPGPPSQGPDPRREEETGFDAWRKAGVDTMLVVPRASTHLEYTDIPLVLPASRYGQDLASVYVQAWLGKYLKHEDEPLLAQPAKRSKRAHHRRKRRHRSARRRHKHRASHHAAAPPAAPGQTATIVQPDPLLATNFTYLEPVAIGKWSPVSLQRSPLLSFYFCSGYAMHDPENGALISNLDLGGVGGCG